MAELNDDMCTLNPDTYEEALINKDDDGHGFHEASSLRKVGDHYVIVYASEFIDETHRNGGHPTNLDYAVSKSVAGPYVRKGRIIDNTGIDPQSWNNHGSIVKIENQWYVFYHGSSNNTKYARRARVERIEVDEERGIIEQVEMTSQGFSHGLDAMAVRSDWRSISYRERRTLPTCTYHRWLQRKMALYRVLGGCQLDNRDRRNSSEGMWN